MKSIPALPAQARRIMVVGCGGAGKSTLSVELCRLLGIEVIHLDRLFWKPGWASSENEEFDRKVADAAALPEWIIDGNYIRTMPIRLARADAVIYLDYPRLVCLWGVLVRQLQNRGRTRPDMAEGCPEKVDAEFLSWVWNFKKNHGKRELELLEQSGKPVLIFKRRAELKRFLHALSASL